MKFKYIGDHDQIHQHDILFKRNEPVDVTGKKLVLRKKVFRGKQSYMEDRIIMVEDKLRGNPDFEEVLEYEGNEILLAEKPRKKPGPKPKNHDENRIT